MPKILHRFIACWRYTLNDKLSPFCGEKVVYAHPAKYSPEDRYGKYRRQLKRQQQTN